MVAAIATVALVTGAILSAGCAENALPPLPPATSRPGGTVGTTPPTLPYSSDDVPTMKVAAVEDGEQYRFEAPDVVPAGPLGVEVENRGKQPHDLAIVRAKPNITAAQVGELLSGPAPEAASTIAQFLGGAGPVAAQGRQSIAVKLEPGEHFLVSMFRGVDGRVGASHGMVRRLTVVTPSESVARRAKAPHEGAGVTITDDSVKLPDGFGLSGWYKVANTGQQPHELVIIKLNEGATADDAKAWLNAVETGPPPNAAPFVYVAGSAALDPNRSDAIQLDLGKGSFVAYCSLPDRQNGFTPSYANGVFLPFSRA